MTSYLTQVLAAMVILSLVRPEAGAQRVVLPVKVVTELSRMDTAPAETGVYTEDLATYTAKDYTEHAEWDIWARALRLEHIYGHYLQQSPAMASDGNGNAIVVWMDDRNGNWDIYAQKVDGSGSRLWAADVRVNSDSGMVGQEYPTISVDESGNAIVVWEDWRNGNDDIYAQRLDGGGSRLWAADVRVNSDSGMAYQEDPVVAADESGNAVAVWYDERNGNADIYAQRLDGGGSRLWAADVRVNSDSGTAGQGSPAVVVDVSGNAVVVWGDERNGNEDIYAQRLNGGGSRLWVADVRVNSDSGTAGQGAPAVAVDGSGNATVVWVDSRNDNSDIYVQWLDTGGNRLWAADVRTNSDGGTASQYSPAVTVDGSGNAIVVWWDERQTDDGIYAQRLDGSGNKLWVADVRVNSDSGTAYQRHPAVVVYGSTNVIVVWQDRRNGDYDIYARKLDEGGNKLWVADVRVNCDSGTADQWDPTAAVDGSGNAVVMWEDYRSGNLDIYAQKMDWSGNRLWAASVRANLDSGTADQHEPAAVVDGSGNAVVVWEDERNGNDDIYAQRLDGNGNRLWVADVRVNSDSGMANQWEPAVAVDGSGNAIVVWEDKRNGNDDIYAQKLDGGGNKLWVADVRVNSDNGTADQWYPAMSVDGSGNAVVVWMDDRNGNDDIYAQKMDGNGNRLWAADARVNFDSGTAWRAYPAVAVDGSGNAVVVWEDDRNGNEDIYAQRLDGGGSKLWAADVRVNSDSGMADQENPVVAADESGNAVAVWEDWRNGNVDIYAQRLDGNGNRLWAADARVNSGSGATDQWEPAVAVDGGGNAVVVWSDVRNGNGDIYAQQINSVGGKVWLADLQVVYPDPSYFLTGTAQSRTIDTVAGNIRSATLTAGYQANGGTVQFYLTNDGGAHWITAPIGAATVFTTTGSDLRWRAVLSVNPIWNRTPVVNSLRIEYSTEMPGGDEYEEDDTCSQARKIQVNGAVQAHNFHQPDDEDWAWFDVTSGTAYTILASEVQARADVELGLYYDCAASPVYTDTNPLGPDARLAFRPEFSGTVWVQVQNYDGQVYGEQTDYNLSVRAERPHQGLAIIAAGRLKMADSLQPNINRAANRAYLTFLERGYSREDIWYLNVEQDQDVDGNGLKDDVDGVTSVAGLREAIQTWARGRGVGPGVPLYIYLMDHGAVDRFCADVGEVVTAELLHLWLGNLEQTSGADEITVIVEACRSGSFIDQYEEQEQGRWWGLGEVAGPNRVIVSSTSSWANAWPLGDGVLFSDAFWGGMREGRSVWGSFQVGQRAVHNAGHENCVRGDRGCQEPWLDDDGDGVPNEEEDGRLAQARGLVVPLGWEVPEIAWVRVGKVSEGGEATIEAEVRDEGVVAGVEALVIPPGYEPEDPGDEGMPEWGVPKVGLEPAGGRKYVGRHSGFTGWGNYRVVVYAWDEDGHTAVPQGVQVCVGCVYLPLTLRSW